MHPDIHIPRVPLSSGLLQPVYRRSVSRIIANYPAIFQTVHERLNVTILDVSNKGAKLAVSKAIEAGLSARLFVDGRDIYCTVIWASGDQCGLQFEHPMPPEILDKVLEESTQEIIPVACPHFIPRGKKRSRKLVCE